MRIIKTKVYQYSELSDIAKERARNWFRATGDEDNYFSESVIEDAATVGDILGIDIRTRAVRLMSGASCFEPCVYWSGFSSQGDGACFEGNYRYKKGAVKAIASYAPEDAELLRIARELQAVQKGYFYRLTANAKQRGHYQHSGCMAVEVDYTGDDSRDISAAESDITELLRDFADWIYRQLEREYDYQNSDESVTENIAANGYEFTAEGVLA